MSSDQNASHDAPASRRRFLVSLAGGAAALLTTGTVARAVAQPPKPAPKPAAKPAAKGALPRAITIYKDPNCGCCKLWVDHVRAAGYVATVHDTADMESVKASMGVPADLKSCHTARVGNYTIEGHVPADVITQLLREAPAGRGIAVPGMPAGSPGMEMGNRKDKYDIMLFDKSGKSRVYASRG